MQVPLGNDQPTIHRSLAEIATGDNPTDNGWRPGNMLGARPVFLEVNYGGDLNLHQLAHGARILDAAYEGHLRWCGYRLR